MRHHRSAKFAEYLSTFAILQYIGLHDTVLIEKRDSSAGFGVFVRDACDAGTTLFAIPSRCCCSNSVLRAVGVPIGFHDITSRPSHSNASLAEETSSLNGGLFTYLCGSMEEDAPPSAARWVELCWRLSLEMHRSYSPLWGWLSAIPSHQDFSQLTAGAAATCRVAHPHLEKYWKQGEERIQKELAEAYAILEPRTLLAPPQSFFRACLTLLSRGLWIPCCRRKETLWERELEKVELGVVPYLDLINGEDDIGRAANARVEVALTIEDLPSWYVDFVHAEESRKDKSAAGSSQDSSQRDYLSWLFQNHYCMCVALEKPLLPGEEVVLSYPSPIVRTEGGLSENDDRRLSRLLRYFY